MKVAIDAGHGYNTPGKRSPNDQREWTANNGVVTAMGQVLAANGVAIIRLDDPTGRTDVGLNTRTKAANDFGADYVISVHHNANAGTWFSGGGTETLIYGHRADVDKLADTLQNAALATYGLANRGIKVRGNDLAILRDTKAPAALIEIGFMDSSNDNPIIFSPENQAVMGKALAEAFVNSVMGGGAVTPPPVVAPNTPSTPSTPTGPIVKGDQVTFINKVDYKGIKLAVSGVYDVIQAIGDRIVVGKGGAVTAAVKASNLQKVGTTYNPAPPAPAPSQASVEAVGENIWFTGGRWGSGKTRWANLDAEFGAGFGQKVQAYINQRWG
jgi:hypothetical protein